MKCCDADDDDYEMWFGDSDFCCDAEGLFKKGRFNQKSE